MDGFKNIEINNFRGIDHLKIEDFSRVNIFLGQNSSGKSSVLECLLLLMGMSNPDLPQTINSMASKDFQEGGRPQAFLSARASFACTDSRFVVP